MSKTVFNYEYAAKVSNMASYRKENWMYMDDSIRDEASRKRAKSKKAWKSLLKRKKEKKI